MTSFRNLGDALEYAGKIVYYRRLDGKIRYSVIIPPEEHLNKVFYFLENKVIFGLWRDTPEEAMEAYKDKSLDKIYRYVSLKEVKLYEEPSTIDNLWE